MMKRPNRMGCRHVDRVHRDSARIHDTTVARSSSCRGACARRCAQLERPDRYSRSDGGRGRDVSFPISCGADIQPRFDAALAALHSFWYGQALKEFTAITEAKPDCAMAYWGIAMSVWNQIWAPP